MTDAPPPPLRVRTERRRRPLGVGLALGAVGLLSIVAGSATSWLNQAIQVAAPVARVEVPSTTTFDADDRTYAIVLDRISSAARLGVTKADPVVDVRCTITLADRTTTMVDGSRSTVRVDTDLGTSVGTFVAVEGTTTVACDWTRQPSDAYRLTIAPERPTVVLFGLGALVGGIVLVLVAVPFVWVGLRGTVIVEQNTVLASDI